MDNREFAQVLLSEATDLLSESYGQNGAGKKFYDQRIEKDEKFIKDNKKKADMYERAGYGDKGPGQQVKDAEDRIKKNKEIRDTRYDTHVPGTSSAALSQKRERAFMSTKMNMHDDYGKIAMYPSQYGIKRKYLNDDQTALHRRINNRAKRAQNESIAVLLTEAALLLNE